MRRTAGLLGLLAALAGCGEPDYADGVVRLAMTRQRAIALAYDAVAVLPAAGFTLRGLSGERVVCSEAPDTQVAYDVEALLIGPGSAATQVAAVVRALGGDGWRVAARSRARPGRVTLERAERYLRVEPSPRRGLRAVVLTSPGACVNFPDDHIPDSALHERLPLSPAPS